MFLELPELNPRPFPRLRYIEYSGPVSPAVLQFLTSHSPLLCSLTLKASESVLEPSSALRFLHLNTKPDLESLRLELVVATKGATLLSEMKRCSVTAETIRSSSEHNEFELTRTRP